MDRLGILLPNLIIYTINFAVMLFILRMLAYEPIVAMLNERRERIREGLAEAERVKEQAAAERAQLEAQMADERRTSQQKLTEAVARSEEASSTRANALVGLQNEIADLALLAASKVLQEGVDESRHRALVDKFLREELGGLA